MVICLESNAQQVNVQGDIKGLTENKISILYHNGTEFKIDTVTVKDEKFAWSQMLNGPTLAMLRFANQSTQIFIEPGLIKLKGNVTAPDTLQVTGSKVNDYSRTLYRKLDDLNKKRDSIIEHLSRAPENEKPKLRLKEAALDSEIINRKYTFIKADPSNIVSLILVLQLANNEGYDTALKAYNLLSNAARSTNLGKQIKDDISFLTNKRIGVKMPDFVQNDPNGNPVNFASFRGKYVYIDFWASWCIPCRAENPNVLKAYQKHKDSNFTVVGVSLDDDLSSWKRAIKQDKMPWTMVSDLKGKMNEIAVFFGITGIPSTLLLDPEGKIIATDLVGKDLHNKLDELFDK